MAKDVAKTMDIVSAINHGMDTNACIVSENKNIKLYIILLSNIVQEVICTKPEKYSVKL